MSRSGYTDDCEGGEAAMWRGCVASSIRGKRGQKMLRTLLKALDEMPEKRLIAHDLVRDGEVCTLGAAGKALGITDLDKLDPEEHDVLAERFDIAPCLIQEIEYENDEGNYRSETPEERWTRMRAWVAKQIKPEAVEQTGGNRP